MIKLVIFDLHGTLARPNVVTDEYVASRYLIERGYDVYPQELRAAWQYVCFVDQPRHGFKDYPSMLGKTMERLDIEVDEGSIDGLATLYQQNDYTLFEDAEPAVRRAKEMNLKTIGLTGGDGGILAKIADMSFIVPSKITARIQEAHITIGHIICELAEEILCG